MQKTTLRSSFLVLSLGLALALGACAKKQVRQEGVSEPAPSAPAATTPPVAAKPVERPAPTPPPPPQSGAEQPAPAQPVTGAGLAQETMAGLERIHFEFDKSAITPESRDILARNAEILTASPGVRIRIEGHCDERGTTEYNLALGERRAKSAFQYLMDLGIDPNRMSVVSYGEEVPLDPGHDEGAWAKNRRAEFVEAQR